MSTTTFEAIIHPFTPGARGTCIFPVHVPTEGAPQRMVPCGKMRGLHASLVKVNAAGEVVQGNHLVAAAKALGLPLLYEVLDK